MKIMIFCISFKLELMIMVSKIYYGVVISIRRSSEKNFFKDKGTTSGHIIFL